MSFETFFKENPLFHREELLEYARSAGSYNPNTLKAALQYHLAKKHLARIRRGYYLVASGYSGVSIESDHLLIAGRMAQDAVISYHSAMEFHALAYSVGAVVYFNSDERIGSFACAYGRYQQIAHPRALKPKDMFFETKTYDRTGMDVRVTSIERTLVDCLYHPELAGGWEEIWRSFESIDFLDVERLIRYALRLGNATTISKLGFFLEQHQAQFSVKEEDLDQLMHYRPKSRHYMDKKNQAGAKNFKRWNLIVPQSVVNKMWEEPHNDTV